MEEVWNQGERDYIKDFFHGGPTIRNILVQGHPLSLSHHLMEHFSVIETESAASIMAIEEPTFQDREIKQALKALKNNKAAGQDNKIGELLKVLSDSNIFTNMLKNSFDKTLRWANSTK